MIKLKGRLEPVVLKQLLKLRKKVWYEDDKFLYHIPKYYIPDFKVKTRGKNIFIEVKGYLRIEDKRKMERMRKEHPDLDIRMVFQKNNKISKRHKMRYSDWCEKYGFKYWILDDMGPINRSFLQ